VGKTNFRLHGDYPDLFSLGVADTLFTLVKLSVLNIRNPSGDKSMSNAINPSNEQVSRRRLFVGAGTVGALAAAASVVPTMVANNAPAGVAKIAPVSGGGYTLSEHVKRYYKTTLV
jgi:hypothetical protein